MPSSQSERFLLCVALLCGVIAAWQLALHAGDNSFLDGICAAVAPAGLPDERRAERLFHWVSVYDNVRVLDDAANPPDGLLTSRVMVEHRAYFRENCGSKAALLVMLARRAGLPARELRLCDAGHVARHVVSEIRVRGRWAVFDPTAALAFRRRDGRPATAAELRDRALLLENARRAPRYDLRRWRFDHAERLHFERLPFVGAMLRRLAPRLTGRPAEEWTLPSALERPRQLFAGACLTLALLAVAAAALTRRRRALRLARRQTLAPTPLRGLALEAEQD
jgi:hypothetical protein